MDKAWWKRYLREVRESFSGELLTCSQASQRMGVPWVRSEPKRLEGFSTHPNSIVSGGNSGYCAVQVAILWGATRVILLGYDMGHTEGRSHWHGDHPPGMGNRGHFDKWVARFNALGPLAAERGVEIINCTRATAITGIPRKPLEQVLC